MGTSTAGSGAVGRGIPCLSCEQRPDVSAGWVCPGGAASTGTGARDCRRLRSSRWRRSGYRGCPSGRTNHPVRRSAHRARPCPCLHQPPYRAGLGRGPAGPARILAPRPALLIRSAVPPRGASRRGIARPGVIVPVSRRPGRPIPGWRRTGSGPGDLGTVRSQASRALVRLRQQAGRRAAGFSRAEIAGSGLVAWNETGVYTMALDGSRRHLVLAFTSGSATGVPPDDPGVGKRWQRAAAS